MRGGGRQDRGVLEKYVSPRDIDVDPYHAAAGDAEFWEAWRGGDHDLKVLRGAPEVDEEEEGATDVRAARRGTEGGVHHLGPGGIADHGPPAPNALENDGERRGGALRKGQEVRDEEVPPDPVQGARAVAIEHDVAVRVAELRGQIEGDGAEQRVLDSVHGCSRPVARGTRTSRAREANRALPTRRPLWPLAPRRSRHPCEPSSTCWGVPRGSRGAR